MLLQLSRKPVGGGELRWATDGGHVLAGTQSQVSGRFRGSSNYKD